MARNYFLYVAILLTIAIAVGSLISLNNGLGIGVQISDKILHAFGYCLLTANWLLTFKPKTYRWKTTVSVGLAVFIYGIIIEILQGVFTNSRQADLFDVFANFAGIIVATLLFMLVFIKKSS